LLGGVGYEGLSPLPISTKKGTRNEAAGGRRGKSLRDSTYP